MTSHTRRLAQLILGKATFEEATALRRSRNPVDMIVGEIFLDALRRSDPLSLGPVAAAKIRATITMLESLAVSAAIVAPVMLFFSRTLSLAVVVLALASLIVAEIVPAAWRSVLANGIDQEMPALLVYLLPYTASPRYLADVLTSIPENIFKWARHEAAKLELLLGSGMDPLSALEELARTTPSRALQKTLKEYVTLQRIGATRSEMTVRLVERAVKSVEEKWRSYSALGRVIVEAVASSIVAVSALAPLVGGPRLLSISALIILGSTAGAILLVLSRPRIGDIQAPASIAAVTLGTPLLAGLLLYEGLDKTAIALLAGTVVLVEYYAAKYRRTYIEALSKLEEAAERARLGLDYDSLLEKAEAVGGDIVRAVAEASRIAGSIGVGGALEKLVEVLEEAGRVRRSVWAEALVLEALSGLAPIMSVYAVIKLGALTGQAPQWILPALKPRVLIRVLVPTVPVSVLPASVLRRGRLASQLGGLLAALGVLLLLKLML